MLRHCISGLFLSDGSFSHVPLCKAFSKEGVPAIIPFEQLFKRKPGVCRIVFWDEELPVVAKTTMLS